MSEFAIDSVVAETLESITAINTEIASLTEMAKQKRKAAMEPFLAALAASGKVSAIFICGYTPSFNDGEECEHSSTCYVNLEEISDNEALDYGTENYVMLTEDMNVEAFLEGLAFDHQNPTGAEQDNIAYCQKHGHVYEAPPAEVRKAIEQVIHQTIEDEKDTNYYVAFVLKDGAFVRSEGYYVCGY